MVKYRVFPAGMDGRFIGFEPLFCESDDEAVAKAERLADGHTLNFGAGRVWWRGSRVRRDKLSPILSSILNGSME
jgi:hypothetical protein